MAQLKTTFAGLALENPIIISSSGLTNSAEKIKKLEEAGAGAVVLKSVLKNKSACKQDQCRAMVHQKQTTIWELTYVLMRLTNISI